MGDDGDDNLSGGSGDESRILGGDGNDDIDGGPGTDSECVGARNPDPAPADVDRIRDCE